MAACGRALSGSALQGQGVSSREGMGICASCASSCASRPCRFYIVTYALAIYMLNLLLGFLRCAAARTALLHGSRGRQQPPSSQRLLRVILGL